MCSEPVVFLVDDDPGVRRGLSAALESAGLRVETFTSAEAFESQLTGDEFGCLLLDLRLDGMSGIQLLKRLSDAGNTLPIIMITGHGDIPAAVESMKLGAMDFLLKPLDPQMLMDRIRTAFAETSAQRASEAQTSDARTRLSTLTPREREMLQKLIEGKSSKQIAAEENLSPRTVNNHRTHLLAKTGAENTADLVRMAMVAGIASAPNER